MNDDPDYPQKRAKLQAILEERGASTLVLTSPGALGWLFDGARTQVSLVGDPVLAAVIRRDGDDAVPVFVNERPRLEAEELPSGLPLVSVAWDAPLLAAVPTSGGGILRESDVAGELQAARAQLTPVEVDRYRQLCREVAALLSTVLAEVRPDDTERQVAARLAGGLVALGADPLVVLAAGRDRLRHRHPLPTDGPVGDLAMVVVCARRRGLIANVTRWVRFGSVAAEEQDTQSRLFAVERAFFEATRPGTVLSDVFEAGIAEYARQGFAADEWTKHHQGGPTGFNGRDPRASRGSTNLVTVDQAFAWNPNVPGAKVEDTVLLGAAGLEVLSVDPAWPTVTVGGLARPLVREQ